MIKFARENYEIFFIFNHVTIILKTLLQNYLVFLNIKRKHILIQKIFCKKNGERELISLISECRYVFGITYLLHYLKDELSNTTSRTSARHTITVFD